MPTISACYGILFLLIHWSNTMFYYIKTIEPDANNYSIELLEKNVMILLKNPAIFKAIKGVPLYGKNTILIFVLIAYD
jgi:hypothetical protein